jgi:uracil-DNA glycosylase
VTALAGLPTKVVTTSLSEGASLQTEIDDFIHPLAATIVTGPAFNQYAPGGEANRLRRHNLRLYLHRMTAVQPNVLLVGEAVGYRGGRLTGIPFASRAIILDEEGFFGPSRGYRAPAEDGFPHAEATATILWQAVAAMQPLPLLWNAFPFHPYVSGRPLSNRAPTKAERELGRPFLAGLIALFSIQRVVAVGKTAAAGLAAMGVSCHAIRHPSHGGKSAFLDGIKTIQEPGR